MAFGSSELTLQQITHRLANAWEHVDASRPSNRAYSPGLGPFDEREVVRLLANVVQQDLAAIRLEVAPEVPYGPAAPLEKCDLCIGRPGPWQWAIEIKVARMLRNNGDLEPAAISHILSPYEDSARRDCVKVLGFEQASRRAVIIIGYDYDVAPLGVLIRDFELLRPIVCSLVPAWLRRFPARRIRITVGGTCSVGKWWPTWEADCENC